MSNRLADSLERMLDLKPLDGEVLSPTVPGPVAPTPNNAESDFDLARTNLLDLITKGKELFERAVEIAESAESARSLEVATTLMASLAQLNQQLLELRVKKQRSVSAATSPTDNGAGSTTINNTVFVGSTSELQALLRKAKAPD
jgi:hypothetical protein